MAGAAVKLALSLLPESARRLAEQIGLDAVLALVAAYGGQEIYPARAATRAHLAGILGETVASRLAEIYQRDPLRVVQCRAAVMAAYHDALRAEFDHRTRAGESARAVVQSLAHRTLPPQYYDWRTVWGLLTRPDTGGEVVETGQGSLF